MPKALKNNEPVLVKLRRKFILINMILIASVLIAVFATVCVVNYNQRISEVYSAVTFRMDEPAVNPQTDTDGAGAADAGAEADGVIEDAGASGAGDSAATGTGAAGDGAAAAGSGSGSKRKSGSDQVVATSSYLVSQDGTILKVIDDSLDLDDASAQSAITQALQAAHGGNSQNAKGHFDSLSLFYGVQKSSDGIKVSLASDNYINQSMASLVATLGGVCLGSLAVFFAISFFLSRWALRPVESAWRQQQQFVADASHELKTPLTVIRANNSILLSQPDKTIRSQEQWIQSTETEAECMQGLVNDMLYLARPENQERTSLESDVDFSDIVSSVTLQFESVAFEKGISLDEQIENNLVVRGDAARLQRLASTLVDNACKYADTHGTVRVTLVHASQKCELRVTNTGTAIDPEDLPHLFDRFFRADKARVRSEGGFGLGLSIAKTIAEESHSSIDVRSSETQGTTFTVTLPLV